MEKPSFFTSTFSIMTLIVTISYCGLCLWLKDVAGLKEIVLLLLGSYGIKKGIEMSGGKPNGVA